MASYTQQSNLYLFISIVILFITIGCIFIYSASSVYALERYGLAHFYLKKHLIGCVLGLVAISLSIIVPMHVIKKYTPLFFFFCLGLTILTFIPPFGISIHGSHRWIKVPFLIFQPSELLKVAFILYISYLLTKKNNLLNSFVRGYLPLLTIVGITSLVLLKQPDFGQAITLTITAFMLFFIAECNIQYLLTTFASGLPIIAFLIYLKPYRVKRILTFLNPWIDPQGAGFQIIQSLIAIGSGNIWGVGIAKSKQKFFYLPMQHTDFIFSIIAEETGFLGSTLIITLYLMLFYVGIKIAQSLENLFCFYATLGFSLLIALQALINLGVATALLPTKGLGLPFISYGNSALISELIMVGLIINFVKNNNKLKQTINFNQSANA